MCAYVRRVSVFVTRVKLLGVVGGYGQLGWGGGWGEGSCWNNVACGVDFRSIFPVADSVA